jgi:hypothetical protein
MNRPSWGANIDKPPALPGVTQLSPSPLSKGWSMSDTRKRRTPQEAVRAFCVECVGKADEVKSYGGNQCLNEGGCDENGRIGS